MLRSFDVGARRVEGRPAVDDVSEYVLACRRLGYQHQDLTTHPTQVHDWYDRDEGLDLRALDADCVTLAKAATAAEDAARTHTDLVAELSGAWSGRGAAAAHEFAWRSAQAATSVGATLRGAADALATLRDELWRAVDAKVATVQAIDGRHRAQRQEWLAAARAVTTGVGDLAAASELVDHQVKPFVAAEIGTDWVGAMRAAIASIGAAYDAALSRVSGVPLAVFDVPGELGPRAEPVGSAPAAGTVVTMSPAQADTPTAPAAFTPPSAPGPAWTAPASPVGSPVADPVASPPLAAPTAPAAAMPTMGELGGAAPGLGAGVSGFGQQLADLIGGLIGSAGGLDDAAETADEPLDELDDETETETETGDDGDDGTQTAEEPVEEPAEEPVEEPAAEPVEEPVEEPAPPPVPEPTAPPPPPAPEPVAEPVGQTPCEIAADELPQVGE